MSDSGQTDDRGERQGVQRASGDVSMIELLNVALRSRRGILLAALLGALLAGAATLLRPREYEATTSFVPQRGEGATAPAAAVLARQFGMSLGGEGAGFSPDYYAYLLRTRRVLRAVLGSDYAAPGRDAAGGPLIARYGVRPGSREDWAEAEDEFRDKLEVSVSRETGVVQLSVRAPEPELAEQIVAAFLRVLGEFDLASRRAYAGEESRFTEERLQEAAAALNASEDALESFLEQNRVFRNSPELSFRHARLERQVAMHQATYTMLAEALERSRIAAVRDLPVITVIDQPEGSARPAPRGLLLRSLLGLILGAMIALFAAFVREHLRRSDGVQPGAREELRALTREALADLRSPSRILPRRARTGSG